jgi:hypothetical protein
MKRVGYAGAASSSIPAGWGNHPPESRAPDRNYAHQTGITRTGLESTCKLRRPNYLSSPVFYYNHSIFRIG